MNGDNLVELRRNNEKNYPILKTDLITEKLIQKEINKIKFQ